MSNIPNSPANTPRPRRRRPFHHQMLLALALSTALLGGALALGTVGFRLVAGSSWVDSLHNAAAILTGLGPVNAAATTAAKLFATAYALFSSLVFVGVTGIVLAPIFHRVLHRFHLEERERQ